MKKVKKKLKQMITLSKLPSLKKLGNNSLLYRKHNL